MGEHQDSSPFHRGEIYFQNLAGVADRMAVFGRKVIRDYMTDQHRDFFRLLPYVLMGSADPQGYPWATILEGPPGFAHALSPKQLQLDVLHNSGDPAFAGVIEGARVSVLGIDFMTRRRNRVNGPIVEVSGGGFSLSVEQAIGICPRYIQLRQIQTIAGTESTPLPEAEYLTELDTGAREMIQRCDTCFVASYAEIEGDPEKRSVDVTHRGGKSGFVRVEGNCLTVPEFAGNLHFNTLGNFLINPLAGLLFVDFQTGDVLQISGRAELLLEHPEVKAFQGAEHLWRMHVEKVVRRPAALTSRWKFLEVSPNCEMTGSWEQTAARLEAERLRDTWRRFKVISVVEESQNIRSFYLEPTDAAGIPRFEAGQHLPVRFLLAGHTAHAIRTYTLSSAPSDGFFRISVKRDGTVSSHLHDNIKAGDLIEARAPQGQFTVCADEPRPLVLLAAGVGVTPLLSMLREVIYEGKRTRSTRETWFVQSARTLADLAFRDELLDLAQRGGEDVRVLRLLSQPETHAREGEGFELAGRIDVQLLKALLPFNDYDFYLCGPSSFTQNLYDSLRALRVHDDRIHAETFGPSTLVRDVETTVPGVEQIAAAVEPVKVVFTDANKEARWEPNSGSLLDLAESAGLSPEYSCRGGSCGTCKTQLISGQVHYLNVPPEPLPEGEILICCSVPANSTEPLVLAL
ncbi:MAG: oxidoreductase, FAD-binding protein [Pseudomonas sp.]|nr:oxidoreductase, FAD-binding protein [Pseudomonas sp.]